MSQQQPISPKALIFAVDDEPANLEMMVRALGRTYDVRPFTDPHEALAAAQLTPPDMMIVDQRMPGLTGIQLLRALKGLHLECATLMVTAYPELTDVVSFESHKQIFRVIPKPWKLEDLLVQVDAALKFFRLGKAIGRLSSVMGDAPGGKGQ